MTPFQIVKAAYPGIPDAILNEYAELLAAEASALSAEFAATDTKFFPIYKNLRTSYSLGFIFVSGGRMPSKLFIQQNFLNPQNANEVKRAEFSIAFTAYQWAYIGTGQNVPSYADPFQSSAIGATAYDRRLFTQPNLAKVKEVQAIAELYTGNQSWRKFYARTIVQTLLTIQKLPYMGAETIYVLYENGVTIADVDYARLSAFVTYINAYKKFSTEIDSERAYLQREAEAQIASYRQDYTDRAQREKSDLQSKKIQMLMAIDNDTKAATRDFQNMLLNAQNLKQNLRGQIA